MGEDDPALGAALILLASFVYSPVIMTLLQAHWLRYGKTIGKVIFRLQVVRINGDTPSFRRMLFRQLVQHLFFVIVSISLPITTVSVLLLMSAAIPWWPSSAFGQIVYALCGGIISIAVILVPFAMHKRTLWDQLMQTEVIRN